MSEGEVFHRPEMVSRRPINLKSFPPTRSGFPATYPGDLFILKSFPSTRNGFPLTY